MEQKLEEQEEIAFQGFGNIEKLDTVVDKHKEWLKDYKGIQYSIAERGVHKIKWQQEKKLYDKFDTPINCIGRLPNRTIIEFDDGDLVKAKDNLEQVYNKLKELEIGFIRSTHNGKSDYLWVEFTRNMKDQEVSNFLKWIAPKESIIDLNFASSNKVFPVLFAQHWKYEMQREKPIEYFIGKKIDYDNLNIKTYGRTIEKDVDGFKYKTFKKSKVNIENLHLPELKDEVTQMIIFDGSEKIYELHFGNKIIRLEGKEIMDTNVFRQRYFETFGILIPTYRSILTDWAYLVTYWTKEVGDKESNVEIISESDEAKELILDYINSTPLSDSLSFTEGLNSLIKEDMCIYVSTKVIKSILRRAQVNITMAKLHYLIKNYLVSGSIVKKVEGKSMRFWRFKINKFEIDIENIIKSQKEE